ncbi:single-stranded-DNA-specific exonuclease RecJ [Sulfurifustis variabilis]|uniref:single-stranded-DNA-specific exonuclease RecJ n=1 Tax=Sulfurifustis variabilis TaxID=1675686 RepID=UPI000BBAA0EF
MPRAIRRRPVAPDAVLPTGLHPVLARIYRARNLSSTAELDHSFDSLLSPMALKDIDRAVALLAGTIEDQRRILVVADFDADGATSCALVVRALRSLGAHHVDYVVPNRFEYGYGLTPEIVALAAEREPDLLITVDNGISSVEGVRAARARGIAVLITDHHLPGPELPEADAIINPNQRGCSFPSKNLAGVGVAFYCMLALRARLRANGWFARRGLPEPNLARLLDLVALGTVADLVPLDRNNRILVAQGIARVRSGLGCLGVRALAAVAGRRVDGLTACDLAYAVAPRLNAAGRLTDMALGIECLLADDETRAHDMAVKLDGLNRERRVIEAEMQAQALAALDALRLDAASLPRGLCLHDDSWHQGVIGLVASRLKERLHRPVIAFAPSSDTDLKGSARSIPGLHIRDALDAVAARHPGLIARFGGHAMAAGLTLARAHLDAFRAAFDREVSRLIAEDDLRGHVLTDGELRDEELTLEVAQLLRDGGPWGQGFPEPLFDGSFEVVERRVVGERHVKLRVKQDGGRTFEAIGFHLAPTGEPPGWSRLRAAYRLDVNDYRGTRTLQLVLEHVEPS